MITVVVQGPLHHHAINKIERYAKYGKVIFSCYNNCDLGLLRPLTVPITLVINSIEKANSLYNFQNIGRHATSTLGGLQQVDTEFVIKTRSDEFYNIDKFVETMLQNPDKFVTSSMFFRHDAVHKFHASDHIIGCKTKYMLKAFELLIQELQNPAFQNKCAEYVITTHLLKAKGIALDHSKSVEIMKDNFSIVRLADLSEFMITFNKTWIHNDENYFRSIDRIGRGSITDINEI